MANETPAADLSQVEELEQDLLFVGLNCSEGQVLITLVADGEERHFDVQTWQIRHRILDALIDGIGNKLDAAREEARQA